MFQPRLRYPRCLFLVVSQPASFFSPLRNSSVCQRWVSKGWFLRLGVLLYCARNTCQSLGAMWSHFAFRAQKCVHHDKGMGTVSLPARVVVLLVVETVILAVLAVVLITGRSDEKLALSIGIALAVVAALEAALLLAPTFFVKLLNVTGLCDACRR